MFWWSASAERVGLSQLQRWHRIHKSTLLSRSYARARPELLPRRHMVSNAGNRREHTGGCWIYYTFCKVLVLLIYYGTPSLESRHVVNLRRNMFLRPASHVTLNR